MPMPEPIIVGIVVVIMLLPLLILLPRRSPSEASPPPFDYVGPPNPVPKPLHGPLPRSDHHARYQRQLLFAMLATPAVGWLFVTISGHSGTYGSWWWALWFLAWCLALYRQSRQRIVVEGDGLLVIRGPRRIAVAALSECAFDGKTVLIGKQIVPLFNWVGRPLIEPQVLRWQLLPILKSAQPIDIVRLQWRALRRGNWQETAVPVGVFLLAWIAYWLRDFLAAGSSQGGQ